MFTQPVVSMQYEKTGMSKVITDYACMVLDYLNPLDLNIIYNVLHNSFKSTNEYD